MLRERVRASIAHIGQALREPEGFALRWHREGAPYAWWVFVALALTAIAGTSAYGLSMGVLGGPARMLACAQSCTLAAGLAWALPLPALYILNSMSGSRLRISTTFFTVAIPDRLFVLAVNLVIFAGVVVAMVDVFSRVIAGLEPNRGRWPTFWLVLVGAIGGELFYAFGLFDWSAMNEIKEWLITQSLVSGPQSVVSS